MKTSLRHLTCKTPSFVNKCPPTLGRYCELRDYAILCTLHHFPRQRSPYPLALQTIRGKCGCSSTRGARIRTPGIASGIINARKIGGSPRTHKKKKADEKYLDSFPLQSPSPACSNLIRSGQFRLKEKAVQTPVYKYHGVASGTSLYCHLAVHRQSQPCPSE